MVKSLWQNSKYSLLILFVSAAVIWSAGPGGLSGPYLRVPAGALTRINGISDPDYLAIAVNPSRIAFNQNKQLVVNGGIRSLGRREGSAAWEYGLTGKVGIGAAVFYRGDPSLDNLKSENEEDLEEGSFSTVNTYIGGRVRLSRSLTVGLTGKFIYIKMPSDYDSRGKLVYSNQFDLGGLDIGAAYDKSEKLSAGLKIENLFGIINWSLDDNENDYSSQRNDTLPAPVSAGIRLNTEAGEHPFIWNSDIELYLINAFFSPLDHKFAVLNNGFKWKRWEHFEILAGIDNILLNYNLIKKTDSYKNEFHPVIRIGMCADFSDLTDTDLSVTYSISNDRVWAGVDQKLDLIFNF